MRLQGSDTQLAGFADRGWQIAVENRCRGIEGNEPCRTGKTCRLAASAFNAPACSTWLFICS